MQPAPRTQRISSQPQSFTVLKRYRFWLVCVFFFFWAGVISARLFWLQIVRHAEFVERAERQQQSTIEVPARRGMLYDRNLHELAVTVQVDSIYAIPANIADKQDAARRLAALVHTDPDDVDTSEEQIVARLDSPHSSIRLVRGIAPDMAARVMALGIKGLYVLKEAKRFYPGNQIAAQMLGYVGTDDNGLGGLELKFDKQLHGIPGHISKALDARRHVLGSSESDPQPGKNLQLTIDENIQFMAEHALDHAMERTHAANGTIVIQDPHTGQILALAIRPTFNPNFFRYTTPELLRDHAVSDVYEPGSTFKLVTYAAALDDHFVEPSTPINCQGGQIDLYGHIIHDDQSDRGLGTVTVATALARSSDVGVIKVALKLGPDRLYRFIRDFGFGQRSGIELPAETRGLLRPVKEWNPASIGYVAIGQEVAVTPIQLVTMVSTIANGGVYLPPHILMPGQSNTKQGQAAPLQASPFRPGEDLPGPLPPGAHRVLSTLAAAQMRQMMEGVVLYGTGKTAQLDGYSSAGKTGTAQKIDPQTHLYNKSLHIASFAGFAPVNNPVLAVAVIIDSPQGAYYGTEVAAPVFTEVAQQVLEYLGVPHDIPVRPSSPHPLSNARLTEDDAGDHPGNLNALRSAASELPDDDPLRAAPTASTAQPSTSGAAPSAPAASSAPLSSLPSGASAPVAKSAVISEAGQVRVPQLIGLPVRKVIEVASAAGFEIQIDGHGTVRQQTPAAGTLVQPGARIQIICTR